LSRKCGNLDISQPYGPPRPVTGIALPFLTEMYYKLNEKAHFEELDEGGKMILNWMLNK
jgi:hypothetical protein